ncbi:hypothetical protein HYZ64_01285, partial [Candidatus Berkelbacteria bacterium]|nr:hypothetical protein [Candidatus Berkelbacteria bacterium]
MSYTDLAWQLEYHRAQVQRMKAVVGKQKARVAKVFANFEQLSPAKQATIREELTTLDRDFIATETQLVQLFQNLLSNAIKF